MRHLVLVILLGIVFFSCTKEEKDGWVVEYSGYSNDADHIEIIHDFDYSTSNPFSYETGSGNIVWQEHHTFDRSEFWSQSDHDKFIHFEIEDSLGMNMFLFEDEELRTDLKCAVWQSASQKDDGFYRLHKGYISGQKVGGEWIIDFDVYYGGKDSSKYRMKKGASY
jgi:hypothetical protein